MTAFSKCIKEAGLDPEEIESYNTLVEQHQAEGKSPEEAQKLATEDRLQELAGNKDYIREVITQTLNQQAVKDFTGTDEFKGWAGTDNPVIESDEINDTDFTGDEPFVLKVFHGTTHVLDRFIASIKGNKEGQFGTVNYFTSSEQDAETNYAGEGADLTSRIELKAERLSDEIQDVIDEQGIDEAKDQYGEEFYDEDTTKFARNIVRSEMHGGEEIVMELFIRTENPFVVGTGQSPWHEFFDESKVEADAIERVSDNTGVDVEEIKANRDEYEEQIYDAIWEVKDELGHPLIEAISQVAMRHGIDPAEIMGELYDVTAEGEITHSRLEQYLRENEQLSYTEDPETGDLISYQIIGEVIQELGYDSIILKDANQRFENMDMNYGTAHVHVFDSDNTNIKSVYNRGTFDITDSNIYHQPAYHGSPHRFMKFLMEHIGTGEGALAYGWGLYFAEDPSVAHYYMTNLSNEKNSIEGRIQAIQQRINNTRLTTPEQAKELRKEVVELQEKVRNMQDSVYEVDIPDEHVANFLDWDKPLSEQPESVRNAINANLERLGYKADYVSNMTGGDFYSRVSLKTSGQKEASEYLNSLGIKGIKYFDAGSRTAGDVQGLTSKLKRAEAELATDLNALDGMPETSGTKAIRDNIAELKTAIKKAEGKTRNLVVFDPNIIEITSINGEPVEKTFNQSGSKDLTSLEEASSLDVIVDHAKDGTFKTNRDLKVFIQDLVNREIDSAGVNLDVETPEGIEHLKNVGVRDALFALKHNKNAVGWYDKTVKKALAVISEVHPEIKTDKTKKFAFLFILAVTSNGQKVDKNFQLAEEVYAQFKETGKMPKKIDAGETAPAMVHSFKLFDRLVETWGYDDFIMMMTSEFSVATLNKIGEAHGFKIADENVETMVSGSAIIGAKIGNGFFSNLYGNFDRLTMDRWLMRTWGRWTGTLIEERPDMVESKSADLKKVIGRLSPKSKEEINAILSVDIDSADIEAIGIAIQKASVKKKNRKVMNRTKSGENLRLLGNSLAKYIDGQKEAPSGGKERNYIRAVFAKILEEVRSQGYKELTMSDLQALLWYPERKLYDIAKGDDTITKGYEEDEAPDYANASIKLAKERGIDPSVISNAVKTAEEEHERATEARRVAEQLSPEQRESALGEQRKAQRIAERLRKSWVKRQIFRRHERGRKADGEKRAYSKGSTAGIKRLAGVALVFKPTVKFRGVLKASELSTPTIHLLDSSPESVKLFSDTLSKAKAESEYGSAVYVYPSEEYAGMKLYLTEDRQSGFAIKSNGDIVSVFSMAHGGISHPMLALAIDEGGTKLDAFDVGLPDIYDINGFVETGRDTWSDKDKPEDWDKKVFGDFNNGEPDIVYMELNPTEEKTFFQSEDPFYSGLASFVSKKLQGKGTGKSFADTLSSWAKKGLINKEELETSGVIEWLETQEGKLTREDVAKYIEDNKVEIKLVEKGGTRGHLDIDDDFFKDFPDSESTDGSVAIYELVQRVNEYEGDEIHITEYDDGTFTVTQDMRDVHSGKSLQGAIDFIESQMEKEGVVFKEATDVSGLTKYQTYVLPNGKNYKETLFTLPMPSETDGWFVGTDYFETREEAQAVVDKYREEEGGELEIKPAYRAGDLYEDAHWKESNVMGWHRTNERVDVDGNDVLHAEEIQSGLHQKGREIGYQKTPEVVETKIGDLDTSISDGGSFGIDISVEIESGEAGITLRPLAHIDVSENKYDASIESNGDRYGVGVYPTKEEAIKAINETTIFTHKQVGSQHPSDFDAIFMTKESAENSATTDGVPDAPFKKTGEWSLLFMKHLIRQAVEGGFSKITWTTGEQQADRYNLSSKVDYINVEPFVKGDKNVVFIQMLDNSDYMLYVDKETGIITEDASDRMKAKGKKLSDVLGKPLAEKILGINEEEKITGVDLDIGGEGMVGFYDKILPSVVNKYAKKMGWGVKVGETEIVTHEGTDEKIGVLSDIMESFDQGEVLDTTETVTVHSLEITDQMKHDVMQGQTLYQNKEEDQNRASITFTRDNKSIIRLLRSSDLSSFLHESGHLFLETERRLVQEFGMSEDQQALLDFLGVESFEDIDVEQHEKFAETFEAYLREGKAPSLKLQGAFESFKEWLLWVYRALGLDDPRLSRAELTPEIREYMDRMLATEEEIAQALANPAYDMLFKSKEQAGMDDDEWAKYQKQHQKVKDRATATLDQKVIDELRKRKTKEWAEERQPIIDEEAERLVVEDPVYRLLNTLAERPMDRKAFKDINGFDQVPPKFRGMTVTDGTGQNPDDFARDNGFKSVIEMTEAILKAPTLKEASQAFGEEQMLYRHGDMLNDGRIELEARDAVHNEEEAKLLLMELKALNKDGKSPKIDREYLKNQARTMILSMTYKEIKPNKYLRAEFKSQKEAILAKSPEEKHKAMVKRLANHYLFVEATKAKEKGEKMRKFIRAVDKLKPNPKQMAPDYYRALQMYVLASDFRVNGQMDEAKAIEELKGIANWAKQQVDKELGYEIELFDVTLNNIIEAEGNGTLGQVSLKNWDEMTQEELEGIYQMVKHLKFVGAKLADNEKAKQALINEEVAEGVEKDAIKPKKSKDGTWLRKLQDTARGYASMVLFHADSVLRRLDGLKNEGVAYNAIKKPIDDAISQKLLPMQEKAGDDMSAIYKKYYTTLQLRKMNGEVLVETEDRGQVTFTKWQIIMMALNFGTESNRTALFESTIEGEKVYTENVVRSALDQHMTEEDWGFVQDVWAHVGSYKEELFALERRRKGVAPRAVEGIPVVTKFGTIMGDYYALKYDPRESTRTFEDEVDDMIKNVTMGHFAKARTKDGMTKERTGSGGRPVNLDIMTWHTQVNEVVNLIAMGEAVDQSQKVIGSPQFREAMEQTGNTDYLNALTIWLKDTASGEVIASDSVSRVFRQIRAGFSASAIGWNFGTILLQPLGLSHSIAVVGAKYMMHGVMAVMRHPTATYQAIQEQSFFMKERGLTFNKDIKDSLDKLHGSPNRPSFIPESVRNSLFAGIVWTQRYVDTSTWIGAYEKAQVEKPNGTEADWIHSADRAVARSQASGVWTDRTPIERGTISANVRQAEFVRMWTALGSYFFAKGNIAVEVFERTDFSSPAEAMKYFVDMMLLFVVEASIVGLMKNLYPDEDDDETKAGYIAKEATMAVLSSFPLIREIASEMQGFRGGSTAGVFYKAVGDVSTQIGQNEIDMSLFKAINTLGGITFKYPSGAINRAVGSYVKEMQGEDVDPIDYLMWRKKDN